MRSRVVRVRSGLELLLPTTRAGVWERGDFAVRDEAVSARPRVWLAGSREADEGFSIWCDTFPAGGRACRRGKAAAARRHGSAKHGHRRNAIQGRNKHWHTTATAGPSTQRANTQAAWACTFHGSSHGLRTTQQGVGGSKKKRHWVLTHADFTQPSSPGRVGVLAEATAGDSQWLTKGSVVWHGWRQSWWMENPCAWQLTVPEC